MDTRQNVASEMVGLKSCRDCKEVSADGAGLLPFLKAAEHETKKYCIFMDQNNPKVQIFCSDLTDYLNSYEFLESLLRHYDPEIDGNLNISIKPKLLRCNGEEYREVLSDFVILSEKHIAVIDLNDREDPTIRQKVIHDRFLKFFKAHGKSQMELPLFYCQAISYTKIILNLPTQNLRLFIDKLLQSLDEWSSGLSVCEDDVLCATQIMSLWLYQSHRYLKKRKDIADKIEDYDVVGRVRTLPVTCFVFVSLRKNEKGCFGPSTSTSGRHYEATVNSDEVSSVTTVHRAVRHGGPTPLFGNYDRGQTGQNITREERSDKTPEVHVTTNINNIPQAQGGKSGDVNITEAGQTKESPWQMEQWKSITLCAIFFIIFCSVLCKKINLVEINNSSTYLNFC